jgi:hypothetical protein
MSTAIDAATSAKIDELVAYYAIEFASLAALEAPRDGITPQRRLAHRLFGSTTADASAEYAIFRERFAQDRLDHMADLALAYVTRKAPAATPYEKKTGKCHRCGGAGFGTWGTIFGQCFRCGGTGNPPAVDGAASIAAQRKAVARAAAKASRA